MLTSEIIDPMKHGPSLPPVPNELIPAHIHEGKRRCWATQPNVEAFLRKKAQYPPPNFALGWIRWRLLGARRGKSLLQTQMQCNMVYNQDSERWVGNDYVHSQVNTATDTEVCMYLDSILRRRWRKWYSEGPIQVDLSAKNRWVVLVK